jgi:hypothetical protein
MIRKHTRLLIAAPSALSCIDHFEPGTTGASLKDIPVVEATISAGVTTVILSRSAGIETESAKGRGIDNATLYVACSNRTRFSSVTRRDKGTYEVETPALSVSQQQLRKEAYDYFLNLQKNISQTGSLFSPVPAEMKGNIRCLTDPERPVIGYVEVSTITSSERFIPEAEGLYEPPLRQCPMPVVHSIWKDPGHPAIYEFIQEQGPEPYMVVETVLSYGTFPCLDCTARGTKNKPSFWPTDHL